MKLVDGNWIPCSIKCDELVVEEVVVGLCGKDFLIDASLANEMVSR